MNSNIKYFSDKMVDIYCAVAPMLTLKADPSGNGLELTPNRGYEDGGWLSNERIDALIECLHCFRTKGSFAALAPPTPPTPKYRPYIAKELADIVFTNPTRLLSRDGIVEPVSAVSHTSATWCGGCYRFRELLANFTWADTGEPCGILEQQEPSK